MAARTRAWTCCRSDSLIPPSTLNNWADTLTRHYRRAMALLALAFVAPTTAITSGPSRHSTPRIGPALSLFQPAAAERGWVRRGVAGMSEAPGRRAID